jgi:hypothetical protein
MYGAWRPIFADEFAGRALDLTRRRPNWLAGSDEAVTEPVNVSEKACYDPANVTVKAGTARLELEPRAVGMTKAGPTATRRVSSSPPSTSSSATASPRHAS